MPLPPMWKGGTGAFMLPERHDPLLPREVVVPPESKSEGEVTSPPSVQAGSHQEGQHPGPCLRSGTAGGGRCPVGGVPFLLGSPCVQHLVGTAR